MLQKQKHLFKDIKQQQYTIKRYINASFINSYIHKQVATITQDLC